MAGNKRWRRINLQVINLWPHLAANFQQVTEPRRGDERKLPAFTLQQRICGHRCAMGKAVTAL